MSVEADLYEAVAAVARDDEAAAHALREAALQSMRVIVDRPETGEVRPELAPEPYRFLPIPGFSYVIVYDAAHMPPLVLRVLRAAPSPAVQSAG